jgi:hypothetical protein
MAIKKSDKKIASKKGGATVSDKVGNYEKHPFFVKKKAADKAYLKQAGLPSQLFSKVSKG